MPREKFTTTLDADFIRRLKIRAAEEGTDASKIIERAGEKELKMKTIDAYRITITRAYRASETGSRYSLDPWQGDTRDYSGYDEPVRVSVPDDAEIVDLRELTGSRMLAVGDREPLTLDDAVRLHVAHPLK